MVSAIGWRSRNESIKLGLECPMRRCEVEEAVAVIQLVGRGPSMHQTLQDPSQTLLHLFPDWVTWDKFLVSVAWTIFLCLTYKL